MPDWLLPFTLHTDASELAAGAVLTQAVEGRETPLGYASPRFDRAEEKLSPNDREVLAILYVHDQFRMYLLHRKFTLITDCAALTWLFTSQHLSPKMHRWALRMMQFDMELKWRKGAEDTVPDALSRLWRKGPRDTPINTSFLDDSTSPTDDQGPSGPVSDGTRLQDLTRPESEQEDDANTPSSRREPMVDGISLAAVKAAETVRPDGRFTLDGITLADMGPAEICREPYMRLAVLYCTRSRLHRKHPMRETLNDFATTARFKQFSLPDPLEQPFLAVGLGGHFWLFNTCCRSKRLSIQIGGRQNVPERTLGDRTLR